MKNTSIIAEKLETLTKSLTKEGGDRYGGGGFYAMGYLQGSMVQLVETELKLSKEQLKLFHKYIDYHINATIQRNNEKEG
jgi:hypothetical protein